MRTDLVLYLSCRFSGFTLFRNLRDLPHRERASRELVLLVEADSGVTGPCRPAALSKTKSPRGLPLRQQLLRRKLSNTSSSRRYAAIPSAAKIAITVLFYWPFDVSACTVIVELVAVCFSVSLREPAHTNCSPAKIAIIVTAVLSLAAGILRA